MTSQQQYAVLTTINAAITDQQVIQINYNKKWRTVEPYQLGLIKAGTALALYGYCRDVITDSLTPSRWQLFYLEDIDLIELTNYSFQVHADYTGQEGFIQPIFCQIPPLDIIQKI